MRIKKFLIPRIIPLIILILAVLMLQPKGLNEKVNISISEAKTFLAKSNLDKDILGDAYPECLSDSSKCPLSSEDLLYKRIDASLDFVFMKSEPVDISGLETKINSSDKFLKAILQDLPNETIDYSYVDKNREKGDFAFDLYCILGWTYNDSTVFRLVKNDVKPYGWTDPNTTNDFRKLIDETWCISLLAENNFDRNFIEQLVLQKEKDFYAYINGNDYLDRKVLSGTHMLLMLNNLKNYGYDISEHKNFINFVIGYVVKNTDKDLRYPEDVYHNVLYALSKYGYPDKQFMESLVGRILEMQKSDGGWEFSGMDTYRVLLTLRSMIALENFKNVYL